MFWDDRRLRILSSSRGRSSRLVGAGPASHGLVTGMRKHRTPQTPPGCCHLWSRSERCRGSTSGERMLSASDRRARSRSRADRCWLVHSCAARTSSAAPRSSKRTIAGPAASATASIPRQQRSCHQRRPGGDRTVGVRDHCDQASGVRGVRSGAEADVLPADMGNVMNARAGRGEVPVDERCGTQVGAEVAVDGVLRRQVVVTGHLLVVGELRTGGQVVELPDQPGDGDEALLGSHLGRLPRFPRDVAVDEREDLAALVVDPCQRGAPRHPRRSRWRSRSRTYGEAGGRRTVFPTRTTGFTKPPAKTCPDLLRRSLDPAAWQLARPAMSASLPAPRTEPHRPARVLGERT
jgi:hypothetical protein